MSINLSNSLADLRHVDLGNDTPLRIILWGTYDLSKPRTRILRDGLAEIGAEVVEIHADVWSSDIDKSQLNRVQMVLRLLQLLIAYPMLIWRYLRAPAHDIVLVPYLGQFDVIVLWLFARLRGKPVVLDLFLSLYDTVVNDRKMVKSGSIVAGCLKWGERLSCRAADRVLLDTQAHANRIATMFGLDPRSVDAVPVGAEPGAFANVAPRIPHEGPTRVLFYGQLIPLHGIETILNAALSPQGQQYQWHIIGSGQDQDKVADILADADTGHITWDRWVPYAELGNAIENADVCLGVFGTSGKAASVVPNKVYQSLFAKRSVITRDGPAMREVFDHADPALRLVPAADPHAILDAIAALETANFPAINPDHLQAAQPAQIARSLCAKIAPLVRAVPS
jgi:glycosyltransferase involved in cell wall biosynthesis